MSTQSQIPQTLTTMEAGFTLMPGADDEFWAEQERIGPIVASKPGYVGAIGGPIHNSGWLYFCGKFDTPADMDRWHHDSDHQPVQHGAHAKWFGAYYIRKWRSAGTGEPLGDRIWSETSIARADPLSQQDFKEVVKLLDESLHAAGAAPYETITGEFEPQPYQLVGPLQEFPKIAPVRYLVAVHWNSFANFDAWLDSAAHATLADFGDIETVPNVPIAHAPGERTNLTADGTHRQWVRA